MTVTLTEPKRYHWEQPFTGTMTPQGPVPVAIGHGPGYLPTYGWLVAGPLEEIDAVLGTECLVVDTENFQWHPTLADIRETSGCECGNPWTICHPEA